MTSPLDVARRGLDPKSTCACSSVHHPRLIPEMLQVHHIVPKSWGGPDVPANRITICSNTHDAAHGCLNAYVRANGQPTKAVLAHFPRYARMLARRAVDQLEKEGRPLPHTYTTTAGEPHA